jgi:hypothetical protein
MLGLYEDQVKSDNTPFRYCEERIEGKIQKSEFRMPGPKIIGFGVPSSGFGVWRLTTSQ